MQRRGNAIVQHKWYSTWMQSKHFSPNFVLLWRHLMCGRTLSRPWKMPGPKAFLKIEFVQTSLFVVVPIGGSGEVYHRHSHSICHHLPKKIEEGDALPRLGGGEAWLGICSVFTWLDHPVAGQGWLYVRSALCEGVEMCWVWTVDSGGILQDTALENASHSLSISQAIKSMLFVFIDVLVLRKASGKQCSIFGYTFDANPAPRTGTEERCDSYD